MCWLRWISSGRFSQERGVKEKKKATKLGSFLVKKWSQWQASKAHVRLSRAAFHSQGRSGFSFLDLKGEVISLSSEVVGVSGLFQRSTSDKGVSNDATLVYLALLFPLISLSIYCFLNFSSTPSSLMFPVCLSFFFSILPSLPPSLAASTLLPLSSLSLPGVVAMAREPAQMAGQLAFRGRAPQLKLPPFFLFSSSFFFSSNFWPATFHVWQAFISACMM